MKKLSILIAILLSCSQANSEQRRAAGSPTSAPISLPQKVAPKSQKQEVAGEEFKTEAQKSLELKYQYIDLYLSYILSKKVHCEKLADDDESFTALQDIYQRNESYTSFIRDEKYEDVRDARPIVEFITPGIERKYQETSEGHICFSWPNRYTVKSLYEVWEKSPCSEAGVLALLKIDYILYYAYTDDYTSTYPEGPYPPLGGIEHILQYIIDNYPGSWQAEYARRGMAARKLKNNAPDTSSQWIEASVRWINYVENNNVLNNKYYKFYRGINDTTREFQTTFLDQLGILYAEKCQEVAISGINKNGKIPPEAIEMYNKNIELWKSIKTKHPQFYDNRKKIKNTYSKTKIRDCYSLIEKYAPEQVKHKKEDLE